MFKKLQYIQVIIIGFLAITLLGTILLCLPFATREGQTTTVFNAFFTASSATCVTGLVIYDTYSHWTLFGQGVILAMVQIGGLGFMTVATMFSLVLGRKIGLKERGLMQEAINLPQIGGIVRLVKHVLVGTLIIEGAGAILLSFKFCPRMGVLPGIWNAVLHSISAFCNAGFDLMGQFAPFSSLSSYNGDEYLSLIIITLTVAGGIGFSVWEDFYRNRYHFHRYRLHTKMVLFATAFLIIVPAILFFTMEQNASMEGMPVKDSALSSLFHSVMLRTTGFHVIDPAALSDSSSLLSCILMFIGGSPGSCAGGIKTTTFLVMVLSVISHLRKQKSVSVFHRRLEDNLFQKVSAILSTYLFFSLLAVGVICTVEGTGLKETMFEVCATVGTTGMSMGIAQTTSGFTKLLLTALMFFGRIGGLSIVLAFSRPFKAAPIQSTVEKISVG